VLGQITAKFEVNHNPCNGCHIRSPWLGPGLEISCSLLHDSVGPRKTGGGQTVSIRNMMLNRSQVNCLEPSKLRVELYLTIANGRKSLSPGTAKNALLISWQV
jgi:hypothetical protein